MTVEVDHRPHTNDALKIGCYAVPASHRAAARGFPRFAQIHPGGGVTTLNGLPGAGIGYSKRNVGPVAGMCGPGFFRAYRSQCKLDVDALAGDEIAAIGRSVASGCRRGFGSLSGTTADRNEHKDGTQPTQLPETYFLLHRDPPLSLSVRHYVTKCPSCKRKVERSLRTAPRCVASTSVSITPSWRLVSTTCRCCACLEI